MKRESIWSRDLTPFLWQWLGYPCSLLLVWIGAKALLEGEITYRGVPSCGITGLIGGLAYTVLGIAMTLRRIRRGKQWQQHERVLACVGAVIFVGFIVMRLIDVI